MKISEVTVMDAASILILILAGLAVGFFSGILGVGGCFIMVPVQYQILIAAGYPADIAIKVAFGTNLLVVLPTAISGSLGHHLKESVDWHKAGILGISGAFGAFMGGFIAAIIPGAVLVKVFGVAVILGAIRMLTARPPKTEEDKKTAPVLYIVFGFLLGIVSGIIGIGGGVLMVPVLVLILKFKMHDAVGTSTAMMIFNSASGAVSYLVNGLGITGLPPYSIGYVNLIQFILLAGTSIPMAFASTKLAHKINPKKLKYIFIAVMFYMGLKMVGLFALLNLPL